MSACAAAVRAVVMAANKRAAGRKVSHVANVVPVALRMVNAFSIQ